MAFLISRFGDIEKREHRGGDDEQGRIHYMTARTDPLATAKCERDRWVVSECTVFVEEPLGSECLWIRIEVWVMKNRPVPLGKLYSIDSSKYTP